MKIEDDEEDVLVAATSPISFFSLVQFKVAEFRGKIQSNPIETQNLKSQLDVTIEKQRLIPQSFRLLGVV